MKNSKKIKQAGASYIAVILLSGIVSMGSIYLYDQYYSKTDFPTIASVDITGYVNKQRKLFLEGEIDEAKLAKNINRFQEKIFNLPKSLILLTKEAVIRNENIIEIEP